MTESGLAYLSAEDLGVKNHICLLPCGGLSRNQQRAWFKADLDVYVSYISKGQIIDKMFGGFIFNGISTRDDYYIYPLYVGFGKPSEKTDWSMWLKHLFTKGQNLYALQDTVEEHEQSSVDVWISIPYPHPFQTSFGHINGQNLNFQAEKDRYQAVRWWVDQFLKRWKKEKQHLDKLNFRGFLWQREAIDLHDEPLVKRINAYLQKKQTLSMWLPNFGSYGVINWKKMGFNVAAVNSNYYGNTSYDHDWITNAANFANTFHTGLQVIYGKGLIFNETHLLDYLNLGLSDKHKYMQESVLVYQFPNHSLKDICADKPEYYVYLYTFIKGLYRQIPYAGMSYS